MLLSIAFPIWGGDAWEPTFNQHSSRWFFRLRCFPAEKFLGWMDQGLTTLYGEDIEKKNCHYSAIMKV